MPPKKKGAAASQPTLPTHVHGSRLTPRTAEACRRTGIEPGELMPLPQAAFREVGQSVELEKLKWERYEALRLEGYQALRAERECVVEEWDAGGAPSSATPAGGGLSSSASVGLLRPVVVKGSGSPRPPALAGSASTAAIIEQRMLEKIKRRQQAEIEQMFMFEIRVAQVNDEKARRLKAIGEADERMARERERRAKDSAEARRVAEIEKRQAELHAEREARRRQRVEMERESQQREVEAEAERARQAAILRVERERVARTEARHAKQQQLLTRNQQEARAKAEEDAEREARRSRRLEEDKERKAAEAGRQRERNATRVANTLREQAAKVDALRGKYLERMEKEEERRQEFVAERQMAIEERRVAGSERASHIRLVQSQMEARVEERTYAILDKEREHTTSMREAEAEKQRAVTALQAEKDMKVYSRQLKLARSQRRDEYKREVTQQKISLEAQRTDALLAAKKRMLVQRRDLRANSALSRQAVADKIEHMRSSSSFDVDASMRENIANPELAELLERCDQAAGGGGKVPLDVMRDVLAEMQTEGKLATLSASGRARPTTADA